MRFKDLVIGDTFHNGKSKGIGANKDVVMWMEFEKTTASTGKIIAETGYNTHRHIGNTHSFGPNTVVYPI
jgi:hypothetical protein